MHAMINDALMASSSARTPSRDWASAARRTGAVIDHARLGELGRQADRLGPAALERQQRHHRLAHLGAILRAAAGQHDPHALGHA